MSRKKPGTPVCGAVRVVTSKAASASEPSRAWFDFCARFCSQRHFSSVGFLFKYNHLNRFALLCIEMNPGAVGSGGGARDQRSPVLRLGQRHRLDCCHVPQEAHHRYPDLSKDQRGR